MINNVLTELQKVIDSFNENIKSESNVSEFIKQSKLEIVTHDNICFEFIVNYIEDGTLEKEISVSQLEKNDPEDLLSNLVPESKLLN